MSGRQPIVDHPHLRERTQVALGDTRLRASLARATDTFAERKGAAYEAFEDVEAVRAAARTIKAGVLERLPGVLERFSDEVHARGGHVHWAADAAEANDLVASIARRAGARRVVKSKSMASEETGLNTALEEAGCVVTETDLGEWIIQLANETPSHIILPAIHRDRGQIRDVMNRVAGGDLSDVPEELARFARDQLRARFLEADLGVTGVNFGIAETGSILLVTNEGNGRLTTSLPRVHVAVMGMERLVETWDQLDVMLALLPRAATGQPITTYINVVTGPALRPQEVDGPEELHVIVLDNGRSEILGTEFAEMLACIRCGACLNVCPVYRQMGGHAYGWVYSGPMGAVLTPLLARDHPTAPEVANASSLCGACWQACPVGIPLQDLLLSLRRRAAEEHTSAAQKAAWGAWAATWSRPTAYRLSLKASGIAASMLGGAIEHMPGAKRWTSTRAAPQPSKQTFRDQWKDRDR